MKELRMSQAAVTLLATWPQGRSAPRLPDSLLVDGCVCKLIFRNVKK